MRTLDGLGEGSATPAVPRRRLFGKRLRGAVLVITSRPAMRHGLADALLERGVSPQLAEQADSLADLVTARPPDLILVDHGVASRDPGPFLEGLGDLSSTVPVALLADGDPVHPALESLPVVASAPPDQVAAVAIDLMADTDRSASLLVCGELTLDLRTHEVAWSGRAVSVTPNAFIVLSVLVQADGAVVSPAALAEALYKGEAPGDKEAVRAAINRLKKRLAEAGLPERGLIVTVTGAGYRIVAAPVLEVPELT